MNLRRAFATQIDTVRGTY